jgi:hypothetical protein
MLEVKCLNFRTLYVPRLVAVKRYRDVRPEADPSGPEFSIFVGDLAHEVGDFQLFDTFRARYSSAKSAKVGFVCSFWKRN